ncbi:MAG TPA: adenine phosphoribosyltransferase [Chryseolinea sp.]|nr:adenine phosphoribosyltransferase [Chryseolinea sp.]
MLEDEIKSAIRDVQDYPKPGIVFKDITPIFDNPLLVRKIVNALAEEYADQKIDAIASVEARGFIFGSVLANELGCRFLPIRKAGKLPFKTRSQSYALEYGTATIEIHDDAIQPGWRVLVHDDLLATGGTASATAELIKSFNGELAGFSFLVNLGFLPGEQKLKDQYGLNPHYLVHY